MIKKIGFVGIGNMGRPMANRLLQAGFQVVTFDIDRAACQGFDRADSLRSVAAGSDAVICMLPDGGAVRRCVLEGPDCLTAGLNLGSMVIDMSSSDPVGTRRLGSDLAKLNISLIDAPVSGGVKKAVDGTLAIMIGGDDEAAVAGATPAFEAMGATLFRCGPLGAGHAMKALNNYVNAAGFIAALEAIAIGERFGLSPETMTDVLNASTGKNNSTENKLKQFVFNGAYSSGFSLGLMAKDVATARDLARHVEVAAGFVEQTEAVWRDAAERIGKAADHTEIAKIWRP